MNEPCTELIALDPTGKKILLDSTGTKILLAQPCICKPCEEDWTESVVNPIFLHCQTPRKVKIDFKNMVLCVYDPPCDPPIPDPPNGHVFEAKIARITAAYHYDTCCFWWGQEIIDGIRWHVEWGPRWLNGFHPPETRLFLMTDSILDVNVAIYFNTYMDIDSYVPPCMPANGGWLDNDLDCPGGSCAEILPLTGIAAHEGQGRVRW